MDKCVGIFMDFMIFYGGCGVVERNFDIRMLPEFCLKKIIMYAKYGVKV